MKKRIVICADGTWNRPEQNLAEDFPTNILKLARAIQQPVAKDDNIPQQVFYDWGIGSYHSKVISGITGKGLHKNIMDDYRYIVHNYSPGDELYLFGFSRGAYTIRSLCGLINNYGIIKRPYARLIQKAFDYYKNSRSEYAPDGAKAIAFRKEYSHPSRKIKFVGVFDTVGAMGIPFSFLGLFENKDEFYDTKMGPNIEIARHALAIDEKREDFEPTIWNPKRSTRIKQVWFAGCHADIGGSYKPDRNRGVLSNNSLYWMIQEAEDAGLAIAPHIGKPNKGDPNATLHNSRVSFYRLRGKNNRNIQHENGSKVLIHASVRTRWNSDSKYRPAKLKEYLATKGGWGNAAIEP